MAKSHSGFTCPIVDTNAYCFSGDQSEENEEREILETEYFYVKRKFLIVLATTMLMSVGFSVWAMVQVRRAARQGQRQQLRLGLKLVWKSLNVGFLACVALSMMLTRLYSTHIFFMIWHAALILLLKRYGHLLITWLDFHEALYGDEGEEQEDQF